MENQDYIEGQKLLKRRNSEVHFHEKIDPNVAIIRPAIPKQTAIKLHRKIDRVEYTFLQYLSPVFSWATKTNNLRNNDLYLLLYLKTLILFTSAEFHNAQRGVGFADNRALARLKKDGWIILYLKTPKKNFLSLSLRSSVLIGKMHRMLLGETPLPMGYQSNAHVSRNPSKQNRDRMKVMLELNRKVRDGHLSGKLTGREIEVEKEKEGQQQIAHQFNEMLRKKSEQREVLQSNGVEINSNLRPGSESPDLKG